MTHACTLPRSLACALAAVMALPACAQAPQPTGGAPSTAMTPPAPSTASTGTTVADTNAPRPASPEPSAEQQRAYAACLQRLRGDAQAAGVSVATLDRHVSGLQPDLGVLELLDRQPEFTTPIWDYLAGLVDEERVADGQAMLATHARTLARVERQYGVDPATVVAVWGVESDFGKTFGKRSLLVSLSTLSCFGRRQDFFRGELLATMKILERGDVAAEDLRGSWAGAFGHTQFMPTTFQRIAVDFDGDGRRDLVGSIPDALASTANYLKRANWRSGEPWGYEVRLPSGFDTGLTGRTSRRPLSEWLQRGVARVDGGSIDLPGTTRAAVLLPAGREGPAFLVFRNFDAIYSYNAAESYALAIAHLSDRLRGAGPFKQSWPTDDPGLSRAPRRELQQLLISRGHDIGEIDGIIGSASRAAIQAEQRRLGHAPADGRGGSRILKALRAEAGTAN